MRRLLALFVLFRCHVCCHSILLSIMEQNNKEREREREREKVGSRAEYDLPHIPTVASTWRAVVRECSGRASGRRRGRSGPPRASCEQDSRVWWRCSPGWWPWRRVLLVCGLPLCSSSRWSIVVRASARVSWWSCRRPELRQSRRRPS